MEQRDVEAVKKGMELSKISQFIHEFLEASGISTGDRVHILCAVLGWHIGMANAVSIKEGHPPLEDELINEVVCLLRESVSNIKPDMISKKKKEKS